MLHSLYWVWWRRRGNGDNSVSGSDASSPLLPKYSRMSFIDIILLFFSLLVKVRLPLSSLLVERSTNIFYDHITFSLLLFFPRRFFPVLIFFAVGLGPNGPYQRAVEFLQDVCTSFGFTEQKIVEIVPRSPSPLVSRGHCLLSPFPCVQVSRS